MVQGGFEVEYELKIFAENFRGKFLWKNTRAIICNGAGVEVERGAIPPAS